MLTWLYLGMINTLSCLFGNCFGNISRLIGLAMGILAQLHLHSAPMAQPNPPDMPPNYTKTAVRLGIMSITQKCKTTISSYGQSKSYQVLYHDTYFFA